MIRQGLHLLIGVFSFAIFAFNTIFWGALIYLLIPLKLLAPNKKWRSAVTDQMVKLAENWISINSAGLSLVHPIEWDIQGLESLRRDRSYFVSSNHQSWVDIVVLQKVFNRRIPFLRFFLKHQLIYVPILGGAWWALDFPFMKRHSKDFLAKNPQRRGEDLATVRRTCERFIGHPISILNFLEGTRFTVEKREAQKSPYKHLLNPKVGGVAFVLDAMGNQFEAFLDVTISYPEEQPHFWRLLSGQMRRVMVHVRHLPIPNSLSRGEMHNWLRDLWSIKDSSLSIIEGPQD